MNTVFSKPREEKWGQCTRCNGFLTEGEYMNSKWHDKCYPCHLSEKRESDNKIYQHMVEHHNQYEGKNRCSISCSICIFEKREL